MSLKWNQINFLGPFTASKSKSDFHLNGLQSHSSESKSDIAFAFMFAFPWCDQTIMGPQIFIYIFINRKETGHSYGCGVSKQVNFTMP